MNAIVSGADGFIGSNLVKELLRHGSHVLAFDLGATPRRIDLQEKNLHYVQCSLEEIDKLEKIVTFGEYDVFYHFAWRGSMGAERGDYAIQLANASLSVKALILAKKIGCKKFVFASSIAEFETNQVVYLDGSKPDTHYLYGAGKAAAHEMCKPVANSLGIDLVWANITNAYGVGDFSDRFLNSTLKKIIHDQDLEFTSGTQNYDFAFIDDVVVAFRLLGEKGLANKTYIIGSGEAKPLRAFVEDMLKELKPTGKVAFGSVPFTGTQAPLSNFSIENLAHDCGYKPKVHFVAGVRRTYEWLKEQKV